MGFDTFSKELIDELVQKNIKLNSIKWFFGSDLEDYFDIISIEYALFLGKEVLPKDEGVYFLFNEAQLQYIGKSKDVGSRIYQHYVGSRIEFTHYCYITCGHIGIDDSNLNRLEQACIARHKPPMNRIYYVS